MTTLSPVQRESTGGRLCRTPPRSAASTPAGHGLELGPPPRDRSTSGGSSYLVELLDRDYLGDPAQQGHRRLVLCLGRRRAGVLDYDDPVVAVMGVASRRLHRPGGADPGEHDALDLSRPKR